MYIAFFKQLWIAFTDGEDPILQIKGFEQSMGSRIIKKWDKLFDEFDKMMTVLRIQSLIIENIVRTIFCLYH